MLQSYKLLLGMYVFISHTHLNHIKGWSLGMFDQSFMYVHCTMAVSRNMYLPTSDHEVNPENTGR
jgi:Cft2 family RNA processing exonuclease